MIDKYFKLQLVVSKTVATYFPKDVHPRNGDFGVNRTIFADGSVISSWDNALGSGLEYAGE